MLVYITKYALSGGIQAIEAEECDEPGMIQQVGAKWATYYHGEGKDWHRTREAAAERAEEMRKAKIGSLKKQIAKLEKLEL